MAREAKTQATATVELELVRENGGTLYFSGVGCEVQVNAGTLDPSLQPPADTVATLIVALQD